MIRRAFGLLVVIAILSGCAGTLVYDDHPIATGSAGVATLHIMRSNSVWGASIRTPVYVNNQLIGRLGPGGHMQIKIPAGRNSISVTTSDIIIDAKEGTSYYAKVTIPLQIWWMTPSFNIKQMDKVQ